MITNVPTIAGAIPPPANWVTIARFWLRKLQLITAAPRLTTYTAITTTGTSATNSDPIIHDVASALETRRRGAIDCSRIHAPGSSFAGGEGGAERVTVRLRSSPTIGSRWPGPPR